MPNQLRSAFALALLSPQIPPFFLGARDRDFVFLRVIHSHLYHGIFLVLCSGMVFARSERMYLSNNIKYNAVCVYSDILERLPFLYHVPVLSAL